MQDRLICIDSDVFLLLAAADRLDRVIELLGFPPGSARRLSPLEPMLRRGRSFRQFPVEVKDLALGVAARIPALPDRPENDDVFQRLASHLGINDGERLLYALMAERPLYWLTSGDTTAMRALCSSQDLSDIRRAVAARVICLEAVVYLLIRNDGYDVTAAAFAPLRASHRTLRCLFPEQPPPEANPLDGPASYLRALCAELGLGFLHCPPCPESTQGVCRLAPLTG